MELSNTLEVTSNPHNISKVERFVETIMRRHHVSEEMYGNILISVTEAVSNAINHGNQKDFSKKVTICLKGSERRLAFLISDEGNGFNFSELPDPTAPENIFKLGGRGVFLMKQLADLVVFSDNGSTVEMQFRL